jgi:hypothetical protein
MHSQGLGEHQDQREEQYPEIAGRVGEIIVSLSRMATGSYPFPFSIIGNGIC